MKNLNEITDKLNITYDVNFDLHVLKYKDSLYRFNRRYKEFKKAMGRFKNGDYGNVSSYVSEQNKQYIEQGRGIIRGLYTCYDSCIEFISFLWRDEHKTQQIKTLLYCRTFEEYDAVTSYGGFYRWKSLLL